MRVLQITIIETRLEVRFYSRELITGILESVGFYKEN
jgi:hypothetical protein